MPHCPNCGEDLSGLREDHELEYQTQKQDEDDFQLNRRFQFGKYRGQTVDHILRIDPGYIIWVAENVEFFVISDALEKEARNRASLKKAQFPINDDECLSEEEALLRFGVGREVLFPKD